MTTLNSYTKCRAALAGYFALVRDLYDSGHGDNITDFTGFDLRQLVNVVRDPTDADEVRTKAVWVVSERDNLDSLLQSVSWVADSWQGKAGEEQRRHRQAEMAAAMLAMRSMSVIFKRAAAVAEEFYSIADHAFAGLDDPEGCPDFKDDFGDGLKAAAAPVETEEATAAAPVRKRRARRAPARKPEPARAPEEVLA